MSETLWVYLDDENNTQGPYPESRLLLFLLRFCVALVFHLWFTECTHTHTQYIAMA